MIKVAKSQKEEEEEEAAGGGEGEEEREVAMLLVPPQGLEGTVTTKGVVKELWPNKFHACVKAMVIVGLVVDDDDDGGGRGEGGIYSNDGLKVTTNKLRVSQ
jgi:hypothetical protein